MSAGLLRVREVAELLGVSPQTVYRLIWAKALPTVPIGLGQSRPRVRIRRSSVEAFIKTREKAAA